MKKALASCWMAAAMSFGGVANVHADGEASLYLGRTYVSNLLLDNMTTFGGTIGAYGGLVGVELGLEYSPTSNFQVGPIEAGTSILNFMGNFIFQIPFGGFIPYGTVGYGVISGRANIDVPEGFVGTVRAFNFGFGGRLYFSERIGIRLDYRRFALQTNDDDPEFTIPLTNIRLDTNPDVDRFMGGVTFRW